MITGTKSRRESLSRRVGELLSLAPARVIAGRLAMWFGVLLALASIGISSIQAATVQYIYDEVGRLIAIVDPAGETTQYSYDDVGNILSVSRRSSAQVSVLSFSPTHGEVGTPVTLSGSGFSATPAQNTVKFAGTTATVSSSTATTIVATVPAGAITGPISVTTAAGTGTSSASFVVDIPQPPQITSFLPVVASPSDVIAISGSSFRRATADNQVVINTTTATVTSVSPPDTLSARVPAASGGKLRVTTPFGTATAAGDLYIVPAPYTPAQVGATGRITIDQPGQAVSIGIGRVAVLLFDGIAAAANIRVSVSNASTSGTLTVYQPNGTTAGAVLSFGAGLSTLSLPTLPATGTYTALLRFNGNAGSGTVTAWANEDITRVLTYGTATDATITGPGQQASYTFTGTQGDSIGLGISSTTLPSGGVVYIYRPDVVSPAWQTVSFTTPTNVRLPSLPVSGTYRLLIIPNNSGTGTTRFTLWKDVGDTIVSGTPYSLSIPNILQQANLTLAATQGGGFRLQFTASTLANATVNIFQPSGTLYVQLFSNASGVLDYSTRALPATGNYRVNVIPANGGTGNATVSLTLDIFDTLVLNTPKTITIEFSSQQARLIFTGAITQNLALQLTAVTLPTGSTVSILNPSGTQIASGTFGSAGITVNIPTLLMNGTYAIQIVPGSSGTGSMTATLVNR
jgi:YD repeat-containing protein